MKKNIGYDTNNVMEPLPWQTVEYYLSWRVEIYSVHLQITLISNK